MAAKTIEMELIKTIIELHRKGEPIKSIARLTGVARNTVKQYLKRAEDTSFISNCGSKQAEKSLIYNTDETFYKGPRYKILIGHFEKYTSDLHKMGGNTSFALAGIYGSA